MESLFLGGKSSLPFLETIHVDLDGGGGKGTLFSASKK